MKTKNENEWRVREREREGGVGVKSAVGNSYGQSLSLSPVFSFRGGCPPKRVGGEIEVRACVRAPCGGPHRSPALRKWGGRGLPGALKDRAVT